MRPGVFNTLKFQISAALALLLVLFTGSITYTFYVFEERQNDDAILNLAGKLQLTARRMYRQAVNYVENAPRDYPTYYRDVRLYYRDVMDNMAIFDQVSDAFMAGNFPPEVSGLPRDMQPMFDAETRAAVERLQVTWAQYRKGLIEVLGDDPEEPRLEYAAEHIVNMRHQLEEATEDLLGAYQRLVARHIEQITVINRLVLFLALVIAAAIIVWFYAYVLHPLGSAVEGFRKVSRGDFGHQVAIAGNNEIGWLTDAFNRLSVRLHALFRLIDRIQRGSDLDSTLRFVWEEFSSFLPIDWVGSLFLTDDGSAMVLERAFADAHAEVGQHQRFPLKGTLLGEAMERDEPLLIAELRDAATQHPTWKFAQLLASKGMRSAIFLPLTDQSPVPSVLAFATRKVDAYNAEQLELLRNIAHLVAHSFGKTLKLLEQARLAAIGEFASGIAHEIRNPLATISLALDYFKRADLPPQAKKRADLAAGEAERMERLLEEILLYAKPLNLSVAPLDLNHALADLLDANRTLANARHQSFELKKTDGPANTLADWDRLTQVFLNLLRNATEAAPAHGTVGWEIEDDPQAHTVVVTVHNGGDPIRPEALSRLTEPFFTTKPQGTGLGLSIVKRIVEAHGGELTVNSSAESGTTVTVALPAAG